MNQLSGGLEILTWYLLFPKKGGAKKINQHNFHRAATPQLPKGDNVVVRFSPQPCKEGYFPLKSFGSE